MARPSPLGAIVLTGGRSVRMGRDKASVVLGGRTLLERVRDALRQVPRLAELVVVAAPGQRLPPLEDAAIPVTVVRDDVEGQGPFPAIVRGLRVAHSDVVLVLSCDAPFVQPALLDLLARRAERHPVAVPLVEGRPQPLCSAIRTGALPELEALLASGNQRASALAEIAGALHLLPEEWRIADLEGLSFFGVNTPDDLVRAESLAARLDRG